MLLIRYLVGWLLALTCCSHRSPSSTTVSISHTIASITQTKSYSRFRLNWVRIVGFSVSSNFLFFSGSLEFFVARSGRDRLHTLSFVQFFPLSKRLFRPPLPLGEWERERIGTKEREREGEEEGQVGLGLPGAKMSVVRGDLLKEVIAGLLEVSNLTTR